MAILVGTAGADTLEGTFDDDQLYGREGDDLITVEFGRDDVNGEEGRDTISFADALWSAAIARPQPDGSNPLETRGYIVDLERTDPQHYRYTTDVIAQKPSFTIDDYHTLRVRFVENIIGSNYQDAFYGDDAGNVFDGRAGRDILDGRGGADTLTGGGDGDDIIGGEGNDVIDGGVGNDVLRGDGGWDTIHAGADADLVQGGDGEDRIFGEAGRDEISGGAHNDVIDGGGNADTIHGDGGEDLLYTGRSGEGSDFSPDLLYGDAGWDTLVATPDAYAADLYGGEGQDVLRYEGGAHIRLIGGAGADLFYGGYGATVSYHDSLSAIGIDRKAGVQTGADAVDDRYVGVDNFALSNLADTFLGRDSVAGHGGQDSVHGGDGGDTLSGQGGDDKLYGDGGDDLLLGGAGADNLSGDGGDDEIHGGDDRDFIFGGGGVDRIYGDDGDDYLNGETNTASNDFIWGGRGNDQVECGGGDDEAHGGEGADLMNGGEGDDVLYGDAGNDSFLGQRADTKDIVAGGEGDDTYHTYSLGSLTYRLEVVEAAGEGWDKVILDNSARAWTLAEHVEELDATAYSDVFKRTLTGNGADNLIRAGRANDLIFAGAGADTLEGGEGADTLDGEAGVDVVSGGAGDDVLKVGAGDSVTGGIGQDTFVLSRAAGLATVTDLIHGQGDQLDVSAFVEGSNDPFKTGLLRLEAREGGTAVVYADPTLPGPARDVALIKGVTPSELTSADFKAVAADGGVVIIEPRATGTGPILGSEAADWLEGTERDDLLNGLGGNDYLLGGLGADTLIGGAGNDNLNGEGGSDTASYETAASGVAVDLAVRTAQGTFGAGLDKLTSIENLTGSAFADSLSGDAGGNRLAGGAGADVLRGLAGADTLEGGAGADILYGGAGVDRFVFDSLSGDSIRDWERGEVVDVRGLHAAAMKLTVVGPDTRADFDLDGDGVYGDAFLTVSGLTIKAADFLL